jgi:nucleoside-diphosphate-sugar epimerase
MILVTGATGLVGGHLLWHLLQENEQIVAIRRKTSDIQPLKNIFRFYTDKPEKFLERVLWRTADVLDRESLENAMLEISEVYHCAAVVSLSNNPDNIHEINVQGTRNMVEVSMKWQIRRFCFVSSIAAYGTNENDLPVNENSKWEDNKTRSPYARSKFFSEQEVWKAISNGLNAVIVNPGVILGYSGTNTGSSQIFSVVRKGLPFYIDGGSGYVCVGDVVRAMIILMKSDVHSERYILVEGNYSNYEILQKIAKAFGKNPPFIKINHRLIFAFGVVVEFTGKILSFKPFIDRNLARSATNRSYYSSEKIIREFGFKFSSLETCIDKTCKNMMKRIV